MAAKIKQLAELFIDGEGAVIDEFDQVFKNVLDAKLKTDEGRKFIQAMLDNASLPRTE